MAKSGTSTTETVEGGGRRPAGSCRHCCRYALLALLALLAVFLAVDCDFFLYFMPFKLEDRPFADQVVWITGASSGIGAQLAK
jgi:hypothetical protein